MLTFIDCIMVVGPVIWCRVFAVIFVIFTKVCRVFFAIFAVIFYCSYSSPSHSHWAHRWIDHWVCDALPVWWQTYGAVTFPAAERHRPLAGTKLYCLVTEAHGCEQLAQSCYPAVQRLGVEPTISQSGVDALTKPLYHPLLLRPL